MTWLVSYSFPEDVLQESGGDQSAPGQKEKPFCTQFSLWGNHFQQGWLWWGGRSSSVDQGKRCGAALGGASHIMAANLTTLPWKSPNGWGLALPALCSSGRPFLVRMSIKQREKGPATLRNFIRQTAMRSRGDSRSGLEKERRRWIGGFSESQWMRRCNGSGERRPPWFLKHLPWWTWEKGMWITTEAWVSVFHWDHSCVELVNFLSWSVPGET